MRRAVVVCVLVVALAGCSSLLGPTQTPTPSPTATSSPTPTATPSPYPPGYGPNGVTAPATALDTHSAELLEAGSFFLSYNGTAFSDNRTVNVYSAQVVNISTDRAYVITNVKGGTSTVQYYTNDSVYIQTNRPGENTTYSSREARVQPRNFTGRGLYGPLLRYGEWGKAKSAANGSFILYEATSFSRVKPVFGQSVDARNVTNVSATLVVGPEGIVRSVTYGATIQREQRLEVGVAITTRRVGNTTVQPPSWLEKARSS